MNTISKSKKVKIASIIGGLFLVLALAIGLTLGASSFITASAYTQELDGSMHSGRIFSTATIDDNFCGNSIVVIMDENHSQLTTEGASQSAILRNNSIFDSIDIASIRDLTALPSENVVSSHSSGVATDTQAIREHLSTVAFRQILNIQLEIYCRQNVLDTVRQLQRVEGIRYVGVNRFYEDLTTAPNDTRLAEQWAIVGDTGISNRAAWGITPGSRAVRTNGGGVVGCTKARRLIRRIYESKQQKITNYPTPVCSPFVRLFQAYAYHVGNLEKVA